MGLKKMARKGRRVFIKSVTGILDRPLPAPSERERNGVEEMRNRIRACPSLEKADAPPSEKEWLDTHERLCECILHEDPREFLRWDVVSKTMSVAFAGYIQQELDYLKTRPDWKTRWSPSIVESAVGHPIPYWKYPRSSGNLIHHACHVAQFEEKTGSAVHDIKFVFEFGGGYGSLCRLFHNLGFQGPYLIFDLPGFSALQQFYLKSSGVPVHPVQRFPEETGGAFCVSDLDLLREMLLHYPDVGSSLFIATWSISETPLDLRQRVLPLLAGFNFFLMAYQDRFGEVRNSEEFRKWQADRQDIAWMEWSIHHLPGNRYLMGTENPHV